MVYLLQANSFVQNSDVIFTWKNQQLFSVSCSFSFETDKSSNLILQLNKNAFQ